MISIPAHSTVAMAIVVTGTTVNMGTGFCMVMYTTAMGTTVTVEVTAAITVQIIPHLLKQTNPLQVELLVMKCQPLYSDFNHCLQAFCKFSP